MAMKIVVALVVILGAFAGFVAMQPAEFSIARSATMAAPPAVVFAQVNDFHAWSEWSPWDKLDPAMERTYSGAPTGNGAVYAWASKEKHVGSGQMTITSAKLPERIDIKLEFLEPMKATNDATFTFAPAGDGTKVDWVMHGHNSFMGKAFCLFMDMDKMVGGDFEKGLSALAAVSEKKHKEAVAAAELEAQNAAAQAQAQAAAEVQAPIKEAPKGKAKKH